MGENERKYVNEAFDTNWIAPLGANVNEFEKLLSQKLNNQEVLSLSSGTGAIHLALTLLNIKRGDVVICQSFTFAASAFPLEYIGAVPIFVDSEFETWNMDPVLLRKCIEDCLKHGTKPSAIIVVHLYGMPAQMNEIMEIANEFDIPVIEDAAEALGSSYFNKPCGSIGKIGILSFNGNKIITTSGGGALTSADNEIMKRARHISAQAKEPAHFYLHHETGYNYRLSNVLAGIGRGQMEVLDERINRRREIFEIYKKELGSYEFVQFLDEPEGCFSNRWLTTVLFNKDGLNEKVRNNLENENIESRLLWKPLHQQPVFKNVKYFGNNVSDQLFYKGLCLPSGSNLSNSIIDAVILRIKNILDEV